MDDERKDMKNADNGNIYYESYEDKFVENAPTIDDEKVESKKSKRKRLPSYFVVALIASLIGGLMSSYIGPKYIYGGNAYKSSTEESSATQKNYDVKDNAGSSVSVAAKKAMSSVVGITTVEVQNYGFMEQEIDGVGSGVIVNSNGYILTNSHVVGDGNAKQITVLFENGDKKPGKVLWCDTSLDLAMVKVEVTNLPVATLGDSDSLEVGETAIAIGNPLGLEFQRTVTSGIISGLHRTIRVDESTIIEDLIQTDASINPGNSGGPLLNNKGEVVGINTAKIKTAEGLGFSIPINMAKTIINQVVKEGTYKTVFIGITGVDLELYERQLGVDLKADNGVIVLEVSANSPASKAGLQNGDVITKIDGQDIENMNNLKKALYKYEKGDKTKLDIVRNGKDMKVEIEFSDVR